MHRIVCSLDWVSVRKKKNQNERTEEKKIHIEKGSIKQTAWLKKEKLKSAKNELMITEVFDKSNKNAKHFK